ncbi:mitotic spindle assembly checkpoint protein MAD1 isoform X4 [Hemicordylus capensis]|uniref:mitotic spindle assembly checkpoint protein MAD1 isoform X4 n=1 Tax=Hemicordylus capensis TaxID=884348 RepID=UPI002302B73D|nr:mitotic spindle assembly checkpoint protein MAD1 isoform X4 [Hemicordylus capensis]
MSRGRLVPPSSPPPLWRTHPKRVSVTTRRLRPPLRLALSVNGMQRRSQMHMDDLEGNTIVFSVLRNFNSLMSQSAEDTSSLAATSAPQGSLQTQYQQMMMLEDQAGQIHSGTRLLQVEREKMQMELSHKRARIELEKEASTSARNYEREADRNQELLKRIKQSQEREAEAQNKLHEQTEVNKTCQKNMESLNKKLQEKESKLAEASETISGLKGKISELQWNLMNQEMQMKSQELEKQELTEQLDVLHKKWQEVSQQIQALQAKQALMVEKEQKIQDLEQKLSLQEQDAVIVKNMKTELAQFPKMERELQQLREENAYLREMKENNGLLKEEVEGLQRKLERYEKVQEEWVALELEKEKLQGKLNIWEKLDQSTGLDIKSPVDLSRHIIALQQRELVLKEQNSTISSSARLLEKARKQLQEELLQVQSQLLEEKKRREQHEAMVRSLQKRVQLLIKAQLFQTLEETGNQKKKADMLEMELQVLKSQTAAADPSIFVAQEEVNALRLKVEELEAERRRLEEENRSLEMKLEQITLQGYHDPSKTKVLHFSMNPASLAKQQQLQEQADLREECERLKEMVRVLEGGGTLAENLEGAISRQSPQEVSELKKQLESAELKNQRLKEVFRTKIQDFRRACYELTGYQIVMTSDNQYRLASVYAEHKEDCLIFKASRSPGKQMQLLETEFSQTVRELIDLHLLQQNSIPAFLSAVTLDLFSRQTVA